MGWVFIPPNDILVFFPFHRHVVVLCQTFVGAFTRRFALGKVFPFNLFPSASAAPKFESRDRN
jgi:hypothetical protein